MAFWKKQIEIPARFPLCRRDGIRRQRRELSLRGVCKKEIYVKPQFIQEIPFARAHKRLAEGLASVEYTTENGFVLRVRIPQSFQGVVELEDVQGGFALSNGKAERTVYADGKLCVQLEHGVWELKKLP